MLYDDINQLSLAASLLNFVTNFNLIFLLFGKCLFILFGLLILTIWWILDELRIEAINRATIQQDHWVRKETKLKT